MRTGILAKALLAAALVGLIGLTAGAATPERTRLTWDELKTVQATERTEMIKAQSEQLQKLIEEQKVEFQAAREASTYDNVNLNNLADKHSEERKEITKTFAEERVALAKTHADERKAFVAAQPGEKPMP
jgi:hypothetical protein